MRRKTALSAEVHWALSKLRPLCAGLPEALETETFGHPTFQAGPRRTFVVLDDHEQPHSLCLVFKLGLAEQRRLLDGKRFFPSKFGAKHGWTAMRVDGRTDWRQVHTLLLESYRRVALKRMVAALDAAPPSTSALR
ncbi:MAG: MmcQ/YjbR family DNA-binding protein [Myxococcaceae bacterium]